MGEKTVKIIMEKEHKSEANSGKRLVRIST